MSRDLQAAVLSAVTSSSVRPVLLYYGTWASGDVHFWTGLGDREWNGSTWTGIGTLGRVAEVVETAETRIEGIVVELTGVPLANIALALGQARHGLPGTLYFGTVDASDTLTADVMFRGRMDVVSINDGGESATIQVRYLSRLAELRKALGRRFTDADQKARFPSDRGLEYLGGIQDAHPPWGGGWRWP